VSMTDELSRQEQRYRDEKLASEVEERVLSRTMKFLEYSRWRMRFAPYLAYAALLVAMATLVTAYFQTKDLRDQLNETRIQLDNLEQQLHETIVQVDNLGSQWDETRIELDNLASQLNETRIELDNLESQLNDVK
jgi:septal ring factor EnvC (AmiA/AmiB activator)